MDYAATTPLDEKVFADMMPYFSEKYGNPSSIHSFGEDAQEGIIKARKIVADFFGAKDSEIIFTSGATEGNNAVIKGIVMSRKIWEACGGKPHIVVSDVEHDCVLESAKRVMKDGLAEVSFAPVGSDGRVSADDVQKLIQPNTVLVSVMYANNETGAIQPVQEIGRMITRENEAGNKKIYFHIDAAQAVNYLDCNADALGADLITISAHKIYGPKGVGALYARTGTPLAKFMDGGEQEFGLRAGTHNVPGIVGLGSAIAQLENYKEKNKEIGRLRDRLIDGILASVSRSALNGSRENRLPNNVNMRFEGAEGEAILIMLKDKGVAVSTGSACAAKSLSSSHVLKSMGLTDLDAHSSIRFSLGRQTAQEDIDYVISAVPGIIEKLRGVSGSFDHSTNLSQADEKGSKGEGSVFLDDDVIDRGGLPADLGCEKGRQVDESL